MAAKRNRRRAGARTSRPVDSVAADRRPVAAGDSEDAAGTYASPWSADDTGESDEGMFVGVSPSRSSPVTARARRRKEASR